MINSCIISGVSNLTASVENKVIYKQVKQTLKVIYFSFKSYETNKWKPKCLGNKVSKQKLFKYVAFVLSTFFIWKIMYLDLCSFEMY